MGRVELVDFFLELLDLLVSEVELPLDFDYQSLLFLDFLLLFIDLVKRPFSLPCLSTEK